MSSQSIGHNAARAEIAFQQADTLSFGFTVREWQYRAKALFDELDQTSNVSWDIWTGDQYIRDIDEEFDEDVDYHEIALECMGNAWEELCKEAEEFSPTAQRIFDLLVTNCRNTSEAAYNYLMGLVKEYGGFEGAAALTRNDGIGLSVFEDVDGEQTLHYGDYGNSHSNVDAVYCSIDDILTAAESADAIPSWWNEEWNVVEVSD